MGDYLDRNKPIERHGPQLPHWQQPGLTQFVTIRLADSMPQQKLDQWQSERDLWLKHHPKPWDAKTERSYHQRFSEQLEEWLDAGWGACLLRQPENRKHLEDVLMRFQCKRYEHHAWVIMPNHVHLLFSPNDDLPILIKAWKGTSARFIGKGSIWQANYRDTAIRNEKHFNTVVRYIRKNPANLHPDHYTLWQSPRAQAIE